MKMTAFRFLDHPALVLALAQPGLSLGLAQPGLGLRLAHPLGPGLKPG